MSKKHHTPKRDTVAMGIVFLSILWVLVYALPLFAEPQQDPVKLGLILTAAVLVYLPFYYMKHPGSGSTWQ